MRWKKAMGICGMLALYLAGGLGLGSYGAEGWARFMTPQYETGDHRALYARAGRDVVLFSTTTCPHCRERASRTPQSSRSPSPT